MAVNLQNVESSWIKAVGYDPTTKSLHVHTKTGDVYHYQKVPRATYDKLMAAESVGQHLNAHIKPNFKARKV